MCEIERRKSYRGVPSVEERDPNVGKGKTRQKHSIFAESCAGFVEEKNDEETVGEKRYNSSGVENDLEMFSSFLSHFLQVSVQN